MEARNKLDNIYSYRIVKYNFSPIRSQVHHYQPRHNDCIFYFIHKQLDKYGPDPNKNQTEVYDEMESYWDVLNLH